MKRSDKLLVIPTLVVGIVILFLAVKLRSSPELKPAENRGRLVETMLLQPVELAPEVVGFGRVTPKVVWQGISEVSGRVVYKSPLLEKGRLVDAGTVLVRIDPLDYQLKLAQAEADLRSAQAQLTKLKQEEKNVKQQLALEKQRFVISQHELERKQNLLERGLLSPSEVEREQQTVLSSQRTVQDLESQLFVLPSERKVLQAQASVNQSRVDEAKRSLAKTEIVLPYDARIAEVNIEQDQVVNLQQVMMIAHGIDAVEIVAQVAMHDMAILSASLGNHSEPFSSSDNLTATVVFTSGQLHQEWLADVSRISESVNPNQATVGIILDVEQDLRQVHSSQAPALVNGMFVEARFKGRAQPHLVVPESAIHGDRIYLYRDGKLVIETVRVKFRQHGLVAIESLPDAEIGVKEGDRLVLNDLLPAVEGMLLRIDAPQTSLDRISDAKVKAEQ
ncbi:efflux RND transporter periplasmic adaptor subunit [Thaumasiovibrio sp. DFM-14]|uniref:efflux RND transporter periplasmic adaptor subunit n=1 Tax=Thaumasiovibrio sp. DFM-14 TaxID=3384792 RepID=UPI0039A124AA